MGIKGQQSLVVLCKDKVIAKVFILRSQHICRKISRPFTIYLLALGAYDMLQLLIQPWICAPGTHMAGWPDSAWNLFKTSIHDQQ